MDKKLEKLMNEQIRKELFSAYLYLSMSAYFESRNLGGFSSWMQKQAMEEVTHGMKFFAFLHDRGSRVVLEAIDQPPSEFKSVKEVIKETLSHEQKVTASINSLYAKALEVKDTAAQMFLSWFITEQVEEEKNAADILGKMEYVKEDSAGIIMLDRELGARPGPQLGGAKEE